MPGFFTSGNRSSDSEASDSDSENESLRSSDDEQQQLKSKGSKANKPANSMFLRSDSEDDSSDDDSDEDEDDSDSDSDDGAAKKVRHDACLAAYVCVTTDIGYPYLPKRWNRAEELLPSCEGPPLQTRTRATMSARLSSLPRTSGKQGIACTCAIWSVMSHTTWSLFFSQSG